MKTKIFTSLLTFSMIFSVCAFAGFSDENTIDKDYLNAVNELTELGVINGFLNEDGTYSFKPEDTLTRAEMTKLVFEVVSGTDGDPELFESLENDLTDISDAEWARGYINYCVLDGIVSGYGDDSFKPNNAVSEVEALKIVLTALGYDETFSGLVGNEWYANTIALALEIGIITDGEKDYNIPCERQVVADYLYKALSAKTVIYSEENEEYAFEEFENLADKTGIYEEKEPEQIDVPGKYYGYLLDDAFSVKGENGDDALEITLWNGTKITEMTIYENNTVTSQTMKKGAVVWYEISNDGTYVKAFGDTTAQSTGLNEVVSAVTGYNENILGIVYTDNANATVEKTVTIDEDTVILYVDSKDVVGYNEGSIEFAQTNEAGDYTPNIIVSTDADMVATVIIVDLGNELDGEAVIIKA